MDDTFFQEWVVLCQHREFAHYPRRLPHDQPDKSCRDAEVEEVHRHMIGIRTGENHLVEIQPVSEQQKYGHKCYRGIVPFGAAAHKDQQGRQEVDDEVQVKEALVSALEPGLEIDRFFGNIRIPDQHELVEPEIGPEDREGKLELAEVMQMLFVDEFKIALVLEIDDEQGDQSHPGYEGGRKRIPAIHR